jgi:preprotein translocase subunit SecG
MNILYGVQAVVSVLLIILVLLQAKGSQGWSMSFSGGGGVYRTRRGAERLIFNSTIALGIVFSVVSLVMVMLG